MFWHTFRAIVWDILSQMKSPTRQINASTKNFPFTHFFAASVLHRDPAYSILELFSVLNPIWSLVYPMSLKDRSIFYLDKKCCSLICSRILEHELQGGVIQHFFSIFENLQWAPKVLYIPFFRKFIIFENCFKKIKILSQKKFCFLLCEALRIRKCSWPSCAARLEIMAWIIP